MLTGCGAQARVGVGLANVASLNRTWTPEDYGRDVIADGGEARWGPGAEAEPSQELRCAVPARSWLPHREPAQSSRTFQALPYLPQSGHPFEPRPCTTIAH